MFSVSSFLKTWIFDKVSIIFNSIFKFYYMTNCDNKQLRYRLWYLVRRNLFCLKIIEKPDVCKKVKLNQFS